jgi:hypothetical protein
VSTPHSQSQKHTYDARSTFCRTPCRYISVNTQAPSLILDILEPYYCMLSSVYIYIYIYYFHHSSMTLIVARQVTLSSSFYSHHPDISTQTSHPNSKSHRTFARGRLRNRAAIRPDLEVGVEIGRTKNSSVKNRYHEVGPLRSNSRRRLEPEIWEQRDGDARKPLVLI